MKEDSLTGMILMGIIRHFITTSAGAFVAQGIINHDQQQTLVAGAMVAVGIALSVYNKKSVASKGTNTNV